MLFVSLARHGNMDSTLTLVTTGALALVATAYFDGRRSLYWPADVLMALGVGLGLLGRAIHVPDYLRGPAARLGWAVAAPPALGGVGLIVAVRAKRCRLVFPVTVIAMVAVGIAAASVVFPALNANKTARFICEDLLRDPQDDEPVILHRHESRGGAYDFYTRLAVVEIFEEPAPADQVKRLDKAYIIADQRDCGRLPPELTARWGLVAARQVGHRAMWVFRFGANENGSVP